MIKPTGHYVLVLPDDVTDTDETYSRAKRSGIILNEDLLNREQAASVRGTLAAVGPQAWKAFEDGVPWAEIGDKVYFPRHNNHSLKDPDTGKTYFLLSDDKILAHYKEGTLDV